MYKTKNTANHYDKITDLFTTNDYNSVTNSCTNTENNFDINTPTFSITIPCGLSFLCLMSLTVYTLIKLLMK